jgi:hypothetical protein
VAGELTRLALAKAPRTHSSLLLWKQGDGRAAETPFLACSLPAFGAETAIGKSSNSSRAYSLCLPCAVSAAQSVFFTIFTAIGFNSESSAIRTTDELPLRISSEIQAGSTERGMTGAVVLIRCKERSSRSRGRTRGRSRNCLRRPHGLGRQRARRTGLQRIDFCERQCPPPDRSQFSGQAGLGRSLSRTLGSGQAGLPGRACEVPRLLPAPPFVSAKSRDSPCRVISDCEIHAIARRVGGSMGAAPVTASLAESVRSP